MTEATAGERTSPLPGLALGCEPETKVLAHKKWEKVEKKGTLKSMFSWKSKSKHISLEKTSESKKKQENTAKSRKQKSENGHEDEKATTSSTLKPAKRNQGYTSDIDQKIYKLMTKSGRKKLSSKEKSASEADKWRGPRAEPSEVAVQKEQVETKHPFRRFVTINLSVEIQKPDQEQILLVFLDQC